VPSESETVSELVLVEYETSSLPPSLSVNSTRDET
jgi:hypothetical protein